jgi:hypothetical protein
MNRSVSTPAYSKQQCRVERSLRKILHEGGAGAHRDIGVACGVDDYLGGKVLIARLVMDANAGHPVVVDHRVDQQRVQPEIHAGVPRHLEQHELHDVRIDRGERAADSRRVGQMAALAGATPLDDAIDHFLRQTAHHLLAAAVVKRRDISKLEASTAEVPGLFDEAGAGAAARRRDGGDRPGGATADDDDIEIGLLRRHSAF